MGYKLAPDWYFLEAANLAGAGEEQFKSLELAKEESEKYRKEELANGNEYEEIIYTQRCLPPGKYFIGDPLDVIDDYEDNEKWPIEANDVFVADDGTYFALFHTNLGPRTYLDEDRNEFPTESGDIIIIPYEKIDQKEVADDLAEYGGGYIFESEFSIDVGKDRQCEGSIDYGGSPVIFTDHEMWFNDEEENS